MKKKVELGIEPPRPLSIERQGKTPSRNVRLSVCQFELQIPFTADVTEFVLLALKFKHPFG